LKQYKLVISENQDKFDPDGICYHPCGQYYRYSTAAARPKGEGQQAITLLGKEETACPTQ
jgi:hypothetical protein